MSVALKHLTGKKKKLTDLLMDPKSKQPVCKGKNESVNKKATVDMSL